MGAVRHFAARARRGRGRRRTNTQRLRSRRTRNRGVRDRSLGGQWRGPWAQEAHRNRGCRSVNPPCRPRATTRGGPPRRCRPPRYRRAGSHRCIQPSRGPGRYACCRSRRASLPSSAIRRPPGVQWCHLRAGAPPRPRTSHQGPPQALLPRGRPRRQHGPRPVEPATGRASAQSASAAKRAGVLPEPGFGSMAPHPAVISLSSNHGLNLLPLRSGQATARFLAQRALPGLASADTSVFSSSLGSRLIQGGLGPRYAEHDEPC